MQNDLRFLAIIPARGGSKGIPRKNLVEVKGKSLIQYSIDAAKSSKYIDQVIVSTDSEEIQSHAITSGAISPFLRPSSLSEDTSPTIDAVIYTIEKLKEIDEHFDYIVLLQPTQPLRQAFHIDEAIEKMLIEGLNNILSVSPVEEHPILMRTIGKDGNLKRFLNTSSTLRRQDFPDTFLVNGSIYIANTEEVLGNLSLNDIEHYYIMDRKYNVDIDEPVDLEIFTLKLNNLIREGKAE
ncbi:acylneuraminate cytidylyltransferase family protein [Marinococcus sp. PL1-022]|uniref:acylneuraminate cytidylyltransferase family protein n=1 Tax=Marinococcus sp. PL1-022 TaxID=3095363 RepID=UPI0029C2D2AB|nr:acylneuraminate cytidylyltransferase family protein [Marinococcus sp. PL1-022]MDX6153985.1 acylneuraminate cytidylyltransferase family protein [Marinococcus sp. PL1-022]